MKPLKISHKQCSRQAKKWTSVSPWLVATSSPGLLRYLGVRVGAAAAAADERAGGAGGGVKKGK